jgi:hypothetical protein
MATVCMRLTSTEVVGDHRGQLCRPFQQEQVAAARRDVQARTRDATGEDAPVDQRHDRVVVPGQHQGRLPQPA